MPKKIRSNRYPCYPDIKWSWITDFPWYRKLPKYQQSQLWTFFFYRLNDLVMIMYDKSGCLGLTGTREKAFDRIRKENGVGQGGVIDCTPETIGSGLKYNSDYVSALHFPSKAVLYPSVSGCTSVFWAPIILDEYDKFHNSNRSMPIGLTLKLKEEKKCQKKK